MGTESFFPIHCFALHRRRGRRGNAPSPPPVNLLYPGRTNMCASNAILNSVTPPGSTTMRPSAAFYGASERNISMQKTVKKEHPPSIMPEAVAPLVPAARKNSSCAARSSWPARYSCRIAPPPNCQKSSTV